MLTALAERRRNTRTLILFVTLISLLLPGVPAALAREVASNLSCPSLSGSPPTFTADNAYYCISWHDGYVMHGSYGAGNNTFGVRGQIHMQTMTVKASTFPSGTSWSWTWPAAASCCSVDSFYALYWGSAGYAISAPSPPAPAPIQLHDIGTLTQTLSLSYADNGGKICIPPGFGVWKSNIDVVDDIFLFGNATPATSYDPLFEIAIGLHDGPSHSSNTTYTLTENGRTWTAFAYPPHGAQKWTLWWFTTGRDVLFGTIDLHAILRSLVMRRYATGNEWFLGVPLGSEVRCGTGGLTIHSISYHLKRR